MTTLLPGEVHVELPGELVGQRGEVRRGDRLGVQPQRSVAGGPGETRELRALPARACVRGERPLDTRSVRVLLQPPGVRGGEAVGRQGVDDDRVELGVQALAQRVLQRQRLRHRELLGAGDRDDRRDLRVAERRVDDRRLARDRAVCAAPANARGALSTATPCPVAGASTMTRS